MPQKKYMCIQRSQPTTNPSAPSPAEMQKMFAEFNAWKEKYAKNIVDMGGKLGYGQVVSANTKTDGPFVEMKEIVGGYMIVEAENLEQAVQIAQESPGTAMPGSSVEVREITTH